MRRLQLRASYTDGFGAGEQVASAVTTRCPCQRTSGQDTLSGQGGNDILDGGAGSDWLSGGADNDTIATGTGWDSVVIGPNSGKDTITDFKVGIDRLVLTGDVTIASITAVDTNRDGIKDATLVSFASTPDEVTLIGVLNVTAHQLLNVLP